MKATMLRRADAKIAKLAFALLLTGAMSALPSMAQPTATLDIVLDQATIMKLPEKVSTIVVGNPMIADVAVQSGGLVVVTGKGFGSTNLIALDRNGAVLMERSIVVSGPTSQTVQVFRGVQRETYSCTPNCERRITLGDSADYFTATITQSETRNGSAAGAATSAGTKAPAR
jgi:Flp pilus assembly secretin CpaC